VPDALAECVLEDTKRDRRLLALLSSRHGEERWRMRHASGPSSRTMLAVQLDAAAAAEREGGGGGLLGRLGRGGAPGGGALDTPTATMLRAAADDQDALLASTGRSVAGAARLRDRLVAETVRRHATASGWSHREGKAEANQFEKLQAVSAHLCRAMDAASHIANETFAMSLLPVVASRLLGPPDADPVDFDPDRFPALAALRAVVESQWSAAAVSPQRRDVIRRLVARALPPADPAI
jgi:hypothetical protein